MKIKKVHVIYDDGTEEDYSSIHDAQVGIRKTITGCDFAIEVADVSATMTDGKSRQLLCSIYSLCHGD